MALQLGGLHHVTAVTGDASRNVAFYTQVLGMHLVKKTVNQDDVSAYHLFYGDELGNAGTELTFFDWPDAGAKRDGTGIIAAIALRAPSADALARWQQRLEAHGVPHGAIVERAGRATLAFADPEGQRLELVAPAPGEEDTPGGSPWAGSPISADDQIRGLHAVRLCVAQIAPTERILTEAMGFRAAGQYELARASGADEADGGPARSVRVFQTGAGGLGTEVQLEERPDLARGRVGIGGVHHVAFRTPDDEQQRAWRGRVADAGLVPTPVIDRFYFHSVYFREPGGVLFEIATDGPGFATDEDPAHLGEALALPPFLEPHRAEIEASLRPIAPLTA
jgi:glyoxalase family protein